jgi:hypothetical protein
VDLTISRPVRIFALVAVVAAVGGMAMLAMKPKQAAAPPVVVSKPAAAPPTTTTPTHGLGSTAAAASHANAASAKAAPAKATAPKKAAAPKVVPPVAKNGLPSSIDAAFAKHAIVVVSVFDPQSSTDAISYAEAKAGAADAGVGFVAISLLDNPLAAALTSSLPDGGLLPAPGVLIYRRPGTLVQRIDGFTDRDVVAQAAAASVTAAPLTGSSSSGA